MKGYNVMDACDYAADIGALHAREQRPLQKWAMDWPDEMSDSYVLGYLFEIQFMLTESWKE